VIFKQERLMKIMNRFRLKILIAMVLTIAVIASIYTFWLAETKPVAKPIGTIDLKKDKNLTLQDKSNTARYENLYLKEAKTGEYKSESPKFDQEQSSLTNATTGPQYQDGMQHVKGTRRYYRRRDDFRQCSIV